MRTLHLTSPPTQGPDVASLQHLLNTVMHTALTEDGAYGELTAHAARHAKYLLGYPAADVLPTAGGHLRTLLRLYGAHGAAALPPAYRILRAARLRKYVHGETLAQKAFAALEAHVGTVEVPPGSNDTWVGAWYGANGEAWCAMTVTWAYCKAGSRAFTRGSRYAYVPYIVAAARQGGAGLEITTAPVRGDLVCFDWNGDGVADHVGLYDRVIGGGYFATIEGNTGPDHGAPGTDGIYRRTDRLPSEVLAYVHVRC